MSLSSDLISQFVKITNDEKKPQTESTVYGTVKYDGKYYVQLDGSDLLTPVSTTTDVKDGERVTVTIKDHTATITGNLTTPSASSTDVQNNAKQISEFEIVMAYKVTTKQLEAVNASIERLSAVLAEVGHLDAASAEIDELKAKLIEGEKLTVNDINAITATIESIEAKFGTFTDVSTENLEAMNAEITNLKGYTASFTYVLAEVLEATKASINDLYVKKLSADSADLKYANIDFANITEAAVDRLFGENGFIKDLTVKDQSLTGELHAVKINADMINAGTLSADRLVIKGEDGLYYRLNLDCFDEDGVPTVNATVEELQNGLHGQNIIAESITADKVKVADLSAFGATIGGFKLTSNTIHSDVKETIDNTTRGIYMDTEGQLYIGDGTNFIKYYKTTDDDGNDVYKLDISAESILFGSDSKASAEDLRNLTEHVHIGRLKTFTICEAIALDEDLTEFAVGKIIVKDLIAKEVTLLDGPHGDIQYTPEGYPVGYGGFENVWVNGLPYDVQGYEFVCIIEDEQPLVELSEGDTAFKLRLTNTAATFMDGETTHTTIDKDGLSTDSIKVQNEIKQGGFVWAKRANGNLGISWIGETN